MNGEAVRTGGILTFCNEISRMKMQENIQKEVFLWQQQNKLKV